MYYNRKEKFIQNKKEALKTQKLNFVGESGRKSFG